MNGNGVYHSDRSSTVTLTNTTFGGNQATFLGSAILNQHGDLQIRHSTISGNTGISVFNGDRATVHNSIIAGNIANLTGTNPDVSGSFISQGYNLIGNGTGSSGFTGMGDRVGTQTAPIDPKLGHLQDNGGSTDTMALLDGSPASNAGDPTLRYTLDQRGIQRQQERPDIGAFERVNASPTAVSDSFIVGGRSLTFDVLRNDYDADGDSFTLVDYNLPRNGFLTRNSDGSFTYRASDSRSVTDRFTYTIRDRHGATSTATVTLHLLPRWF